MARAFHVIVERDEDGWYVGTVSELPGCHTQAKSLDQLRERVHEAIRAYLGPRTSVRKRIEFVGAQAIEAHAKELLEPELRPEYLKTLEAIEKQRSIPVRGFGKRYALRQARRL